MDRAIMIYLEGICIYHEQQTMGRHHLVQSLTKIQKGKGDKVNYHGGKADPTT